MPKVNGNDGNNNNLMKGLQAYYEALRAKASGNTNKSAEVKNDVPVGKQNGVHHTEMGDDLLTSANFYAGMGLNLGAIKKPAAGSLEDLAQVARTLDTSKADRADKKAVYNAIEGNDWSSYLTRAYTYGTLNENSMKNLASIDFSVKNMPEYIADDLNAEVVIA